MDIEIAVIGEPSKWVLSNPRIRIGKDPSCEVNLPPDKYPSVVSEHVALKVSNGTVTLARGENSGGETYLNGHPASSGTAIRSGDILRLGSAGPELRIRLLEQEADAPPRVGYEPTRVISLSDLGTSEPPHEFTRVISSPAAPLPSYVPPVAPTAVGRQGYSTEATRGASVTPRTTPRIPPPQSARLATDSESMLALEDKLKNIRVILVLNIAFLVFLSVCLILQGRELNQTHKDVQDLRAQAQNAVSQFTPVLDERLKDFNDRMDGMDGKIASAQDRMVKAMDVQTKYFEDRMVARINAEVPTLLDKYIAAKLAEAKQH